MFCAKCGANLPESAKFCGTCGAAMPDPATPETVTVPMPPKKKKNKGLWIAVVALVCAIGIGVGGFFYFRPSDFQPLAKEIAKIECTADLSDLEALAPAQVWEKLKATYGVRVETLTNNIEYTGKAREIYGMSKEQQKSLGQDIKYEVAVLREYDLPTQWRQSMMETLSKNYDILPSMVGEMQVVYCEVTLRGSLDTQYTLKQYTAIEIDGRWYLNDGGRFAAETIAIEIIHGVNEDRAKQTAGYDSGML